MCCFTWLNQIHLKWYLQIWLIHGFDDFRKVRTPWPLQFDFHFDFGLDACIHLEIAMCCFELGLDKFDFFGEACNFNYIKYVILFTVAFELWLWRFVISSYTCVFMNVCIELFVRWSCGTVYCQVIDHPFNSNAHINGEDRAFWCTINFMHLCEAWVQKKICFLWRVLCEETWVFSFYLKYEYAAS